MKNLLVILSLFIGSTAFSTEKDSKDSVRYLAVSEFWSTLATQASPSKEQQMLGDLKDAEIKLQVKEFQVGTNNLGSRTFYFRAIIRSPELPSNMQLLCEYGIRIEKDLSNSSNRKVICDLIPIPL